MVNVFTGNREDFPAILLQVGRTRSTKIVITFYGERNPFKLIDTQVLNDPGDHNNKTM